MKTVTLELRIEVTYNLGESTTVNDLKDNLAYCARHLASEGMLSDQPEAEVVYWDLNVKELK